MQLETPNLGMVFEDRYVSTRQDSVDDPPQPKIRSVAMKRKILEDGTLTSPPPAAKTLSPGASLIGNIIKVISHISKLPLRSPFIHLNHLDIDPDTLIPSFFCDFLTLAWLDFLLPD